MSIAEPIVARRSRPRRMLRGLRRLALAAVALALVAPLAGAVYVLTLPSVGDAQTRARQIMASHHEGSAMPVPAKLAAAAIATEDEHFDDNVVFNVATGAGRAPASMCSAAARTPRRDDRPAARQAAVRPRQRCRGHPVPDRARHQARHALVAPAGAGMYLNVNDYGNGFWGVRGPLRHAAVGIALDSVVVGHGGR